MPPKIYRLIGFIGTDTKDSYWGMLWGSMDFIVLHNEFCLQLLVAGSRPLTAYSLSPSPLDSRSHSVSIEMQ